MSASVHRYGLIRRPKPKTKAAGGRPKARARPEWNEYLTDAAQYKLKEEEVNRRKAAAASKHAALYRHVTHHHHTGGGAAGRKVASRKRLDVARRQAADRRMLAEDSDEDSNEDSDDEGLRDASELAVSRDEEEQRLDHYPGAGAAVGGGFTERVRHVLLKKPSRAARRSGPWAAETVESLTMRVWELEEHLEDAISRDATRERQVNALTELVSHLRAHVDSSAALRTHGEAAIATGRRGQSHPAAPASAPAKKAPQQTAAEALAHEAFAAEAAALGVRVGPLPPSAAVEDPRPPKEENAALLKTPENKNKNKNKEAPVVVETPPPPVDEAAPETRMPTYTPPDKRREPDDAVSTVNLAKRNRPVLDDSDSDVEPRFDPEAYVSGKGGDPSIFFLNEARHTTPLYDASPGKKKQLPLTPPRRSKDPNNHHHHDDDVDDVPDSAERFSTMRHAHAVLGGVPRKTKAVDDDFSDSEDTVARQVAPRPMITAAAPVIIAVSAKPSADAVRAAGGIPKTKVRAKAHLGQWRAPDTNQPTQLW